MKNFLIALIALWCISCEEEPGAYVPIRVMTDPGSKQIDSKQYDFNAQNLMDAAKAEPISVENGSGRIITVFQLSDKLKNDNFTALLQLDYYQYGYWVGRNAKIPIDKNNMAIMYWGSANSGEDVKYTIVLSIPDVARPVEGSVPKIPLEYVVQVSGILASKYQEMGLQPVPGFSNNTIYTIDYSYSSKFEFQQNTTIIKNELIPLK